VRRRPGCDCRTCPPLGHIKVIIIGVLGNASVIIQAPAGLIALLTSKHRFVHQIRLRHPDNVCGDLVRVAAAYPVVREGEASRRYARGGRCGTMRIWFKLEYGNVLATCALLCIKLQKADNTPLLASANSSFVAASRLIRNEKTTSSSSHKRSKARV